MKIKFTKIEIQYLLTSILVIGALVALTNYTQDFSTNMILFMQGILLIAIATIPNILAKKIMAKKYDTEIEYRIWRMREPKKQTNIIKKFLTALPPGILLPILILIISQGKLLFLAFGMFIISSTKSHVGKYRPYLTEYEASKIAFMGPITNLALALLFKLLSPYYPLEQAIDINIYMALYNLVPLPNLDGYKIFMGGKAFYVFTIVLAVVFAILLKQTEIIYTIITAVTLAIALTIAYLVKIESH